MRLTALLTPEASPASLFLTLDSTEAVNGNQLGSTNSNVSSNTSSINTINSSAAIKYYKANSTGSNASAPGSA